MKYVFPLLVLLLSLFVSCKEGEEVPETLPFIDINNNSIQFVRLTSSQNLKVSTNIDDIKCEITSGTNWCSALYTDDQLTITVASNNGYKSRTGNITLNGKQAKVAITITQDGKKTHNEIDDVWMKLVPFWQLKLYVMDVLGKKKFYKYICEQLRLRPIWILMKP